QAGVPALFIAARDLAAQREASFLGLNHGVPVDPRLSAGSRGPGRRKFDLAQVEFRPLLANELRFPFRLELGPAGQLEAHPMRAHVLIIAYVTRNVSRLWICPG